MIRNTSKNQIFTAALAIPLGKEFSQRENSKARAGSFSEQAFFPSFLSESSSEQATKVDFRN